MCEVVASARLVVASARLSPRRRPSMHAQDPVRPVPVPASLSGPPSTPEAHRLVAAAWAAFQRGDAARARAAMAGAYRTAPDAVGDEYAHLLRGLARRQGRPATGAATLAYL